METSEETTIVQAYQTLVLRAAACVDGNDFAGLASLFTEDGVLVRPNAEPLHGREAIRLAYARRPADRITRHLVTNSLVTVEAPGHATVHSYVLLWTAAAQDAVGPSGRLAQARQLVGEFDDRMLRDAGGGWFIQRREARFVLYRDA